VEGNPVNRTLRQWHLGMVTVLAPVAAVTLVVGVVVRRQAPVNPVLAALGQAAASEGRESARAIIRGEGIALEARRLSTTDGGTLLELRPLAETMAADVLVYLGHGGSTNLADARLLGSLGGPGPVRLPLPGNAGTSGAILLFYSPAVGRLLAQDSVSLAP
jgi:hypothetical protein